MFSTILLALQTDANQSVVVDPNQSLNSWLVIAGVLIIFACLLAAVIPSPLKEFTTKLQEFNFSKLGISMRVSILKVFVLMGFILSLSSFALQWRGYVKQVGESAAEIQLNVVLRFRQLHSRRLAFLAHLSAYFFLGVTILVVTAWDCFTGKEKLRSAVLNLTPLLWPLISFVIFRRVTGRSGRSSGTQLVERSCVVCHSYSPTTTRSMCF